MKQSMSLHEAVHQSLKAAAVEEICSVCILSNCFGHNTNKLPKQILEFLDIYSLHFVMSFLFCPSFSFCFSSMQMLGGG